MRYLLASAVALALYASGAHAQGYINRVCSGAGDQSLCTWTFGRRTNTGIAKIITVPEPTNEWEAAELAARIAEWERVCEPVTVRDPQGVTRYTYGPACPNGVIVGSGARPR